MENRFGVKDFVLFLLLAALIVVVCLAMVQFDRQYRQVLDIKRQNSELTREVYAIRTRVDQGLVAVGPGGGAAGTPPAQAEVFRPVVDAEKMSGFARGDWLVDNFGTKVGKLTPFIGGDLYQRIVEARVCEHLATRDPLTLKFIPLLAEGWDVTDNTAAFEAWAKPLRDQKLTAEEFSKRVREAKDAPVAQTIKFKLRRGVVFSDGTPMTAEDIVFTFQHILNPKINAPRERSYLDKLKDVKADNPHEVTFTFTEPYYASFETVSGTPILSKAFYSRFTPDQYNERTGLLIGTGPFRLEDPENWTPGKPIDLVRNERYWGVPPTFDRLKFLEVEDESAEETMFKNGDLDVYACTPEQYENLLKNPAVMASSKNLKYSAPTNGYSYVGWNQSRKIGGRDQPTAFADRRVRQAMTLLIDRERIAREVFLGYPKVANGPFDPNGPQAAPDVKAWPFDEARGKALLAEAGFRDGNGDGVIDAPDGQPFRFKLSYPSGSATYERVVFFLKDSFARAGITMELDPVSFPILLDKLKKDDFDACTLGWGGSIESDCYQIFHSDQIKDQGDNRTNYSNPEVDRLIEQARKTIDDDARMKVWHQVHRILHEDQPYTFMFNSQSLVFLNGRLENVAAVKLGLNYPRLYPNPIPWFVPTGKQRYAR